MSLRSFGPWLMRKFCRYGYILSNSMVRVNLKEGVRLPLKARMEDVTSEDDFTRQRYGLPPCLAGVVGLRPPSLWFIVFSLASTGVSLMETYFLLVGPWGWSLNTIQGF